MVPWAVCTETAVEVWAYKVSWKSWLVFTLYRYYGVGQGFWALNWCGLTCKVEEGVRVCFLKVSVDTWVPCAKCWFYSLQWGIGIHIYKKQSQGF